MMKSNSLPGLTWSLLAASVLLGGCATTAPAPAPGMNTVAASHVAVIDAGSSGSRIYVYAVKSSPGQTMPELSQIASEKVSPGVSEFLDKPDACAGLESLVEVARQVVPERQRNRTPLVLMATAGLRLRPDRAAIMQAVGACLASATDFDLEAPVVISGRYEALYSWLAVNDLSHRLTGPLTPLGMLEMGGASTQVAYASDANCGDCLSWPAGPDARFHVFAKSYLYLGQDQARYLAGRSASCYPQGYPLDFLSLGEQGAGDFDRCARAIAASFAVLCEILEGGNGPHCVLERPLDRTLGGDFVALSGFFYTFHRLGVEPGQALARLQESGTEFCRQKWGDLQARAAPKALEYERLYCFNAAYFWTLLAGHYRFPQSSRKVQARGEIAGQEVSWTLGAALDLLLGNQPEAYKPPLAD